MLLGSGFPGVLHTTQCFHVPALLSTWIECGKAQNSAKPGIKKITQNLSSSFIKLNWYFFKGFVLLLETKNPLQERQDHNYV